ncbi:uncharacterized protein LOC143911233 [Arctopsyche grandis]|uniref:uncharacterized protein LOC143911233 n=1 Tax=Arctopsyche grandis TaxID=121162 RepID=UPI00406D7FA7
MSGKISSRGVESLQKYDWASSSGDKLTVKLAFEELSRDMSSTKARWSFRTKLAIYFRPLGVNHSPLDRFHSSEAFRKVQKKFCTRGETKKSRTVCVCGYAGKINKENARLRSSI